MPTTTPPRAHRSDAAKRNGIQSPISRDQQPSFRAGAPGGRDDRWMILATAALALAGTLGFIDGLVALGRQAFLVSGARFVFGDLAAWGWIALLVGALAVLSAIAVTTRTELGRWFGFSAAALQAIAALMMIQSYPPWSLSIFALDILAIFALAMYQGSRAPAPD
jgi:hypothetical protein